MQIAKGIKMCEPIACFQRWLAGWLMCADCLEIAKRREAGVQIWRCSELAGSLGGTLVSLIGVGVASAWVPCDLRVAPCGTVVLNRSISASSALDAGAAPGA